jgi:hypothetical protein
MKAPAFRFERASRRAVRAAKRQSASPERASDVSDPIDEQISSLLESVSSKHEAQAAVMDPDFSPDRVAPDRVAPSQGPPATPLRKYRDLVDAPEALRRATVPRPARPRQTVRQAFSRIAIDLPRPHLSYALRQVFSLIAIVLLSIALAFLIVHLMAP